MELFFQPGQHDLEHIWIVLDQASFDFFNNAQIGNPLTMVFHGLSDLVKQKPVFFQGIEQFCFRDHVPVAQSPAPAFMVHHLLQPQHDDGVFPALHFFRDGAVIGQDPAFLDFQIGFHPVHPVLFPSPQVPGHSQPGDLPDF
jgi:hypothetical protein